jgi:transposase
MSEYIGVDIHGKFSQVCTMAEGGQVTGQIRLDHADPQQIRDVFGLFPAGTQVAMEATCGWMWLADMLEELGHQVRLAHPSGTALIAQSRLKSDKVDAEALAQLLRTGFLPEAYLAPSEVRDRRLLLRHRQAMVSIRTGLKNRVHALLMRYNIRIEQSDIFGAGGMRMLRQLQLPEAGRRVLDGELDCIELFTEKIKQHEAHLRRTLKADEQVGWLMSLPGVGWLTAQFLVSEIGEIERFPSAKKLASYCGLCPSTRGSAGKVWHGRTGPGGRSLLKWVLVEAAHTAARRDSYFGKICGRIERRRGKQQAYVAVARKMAEMIWRLLTERRPYEAMRANFRVGSAVAVVDRSKTRSH